MKRRFWPITGFWILLANYCINLTAVDAQTFAENYILAPGDVISVTVYGEPDLSVSALRIPASNVFSYPLVGEIRLGADTVRTLEEKIRSQLLDGYLRDPKVVISVVNYRPFFIGGEVKQPGQVSFVEGMTVEKAVALAGGPTDVANVNSITLQRQSVGGSRTDNVGFQSEVWPGDVLSVGALAMEQIEERYIYLYGEVNSPGRYEFLEGLTVEKAIAQAGGFGTRASKRKIRISRDTNPAQEIKRAPLDFALAPGDVITVGASLF